MPLSSDPAAKRNQLANLRRGPVEHGAYARRRLAPVRARHAEELRRDFPALDDRRLSLLADCLARCEVAARWLDRRGRVVKDDTGEVFPVVRELARWGQQAWGMIGEVEQEQREEQEEAAPRLVPNIAREDIFERVLAGLIDRDVTVVPDD